MFEEVKQFRSDILSDNKVQPTNIDLGRLAQLELWLEEVVAEQVNFYKNNGNQWADE